jgi:putative heme iron utilization protein
MNADHSDTMNLYATKLLGAPSADWRCVGCDPDGIDMQAGTNALRLDFPRRIVTPAALRQILKELADQARAAASN